MDFGLLFSSYLNVLTPYTLLMIFIGALGGVMIGAIPLPHGFGIGTGTIAEGWINDAAAFWEVQCE